MNTIEELQDFGIKILLQTHKNVKEWHKFQRQVR